ncbi:MAG: HAD family hydrolase [Firmicutes bacterium]|jgi:FMN phosphatase YigB (HAD superfamily)|nr:HAD family hydrolase [Bacillota bacterium]
MTKSSVQTLLFDLDGTLIKLDMNTFLPHYFRALGSYFAHLIEPKTLAHHILASTDVMINNLDPALTNQEVFMADFLPRLGRPEGEILSIFDDFYTHEFPRLGSSEVTSEAACQAVELAMARGFEVIIATNPVFPMQAIRHRLDWGGLGGYNFKLVTAYERMHFCKPHIQYYREVLELLGRNPEECWMVGNDMEEDMVAAKVGIRTFLVEDFLIDRGKTRLAPVARGRITDLPDFVASL